MSSEPYADVREMYMAHTMFRREFGLLPALVGDVRAGDTARARVIADHFELIRTILYHHHHAEDTYLWPRVLSRAPESAAPVVALMGASTGSSTRSSTTSPPGCATGRKAPGRRRAPRWPRTPASSSGCSASAWRPRKTGRCRLIARYVTGSQNGARWSRRTSADIEPEQMPLLFGLMTYEGDPEVTRKVIEHMPPEVGAVMGRLSSEAFAQYAQRVHGTQPPVKSGELHGWLPFMSCGSG